MGYFKVIHFSAMLSILAHGVFLFELGGLPSAGKLPTAKPARMVYIQASLSPAVEPAQSTTKQPAESPLEPDQLVPPKEKGTSKLVKKPEKKKNTKRTKNVEPSSSVKQPSAPLQQTSFASIVESRQSYILQALEKIEKQKSYPMQARRRRISGSVTLSIRVASNGLIEQLECRQGPVSLCRAAVSAAEKAQPLPALPEGTNHLAFEYQMLYKLH